MDKLVKLASWREGIFVGCSVGRGVLLSALLFSPCLLGVDADLGREGAALKGFLLKSSFSPGFAWFAFRSSSSFFCSALRLDLECGQSLAMCPILPQTRQLRSVGTS